jgi:CoA:oxalate CoA-transferase
MTSATDGRPLGQLRVLDLTHALAGPTCTNLLHSAGAEVIKVERPVVGDDFRHYTEHAGLPGMSVPFIVVNGGKRSITVNLKEERRIEIVRRLAARSDVVVENFRPGLADALGLGWDDLRAVNDQLVYCSISGFGQSGPLRDWPAYDHIVQAMSGLMYVNGEEGEPPLKVSMPIADAFSGYVAALAIMMALEGRRATGVGRRIDVSMLDAVLTFLASPIAVFLFDGTQPKRRGNRGFRLVVTSDTYQTNDGYLAIGANHQSQFEALCKVLGEEWLVVDERFADHAKRVENAELLRSELQRILRDRSAAELEGRLAEAQVPASKVRSVSELMEHPHVAARGLLRPLDVPGGEDPVQVIGPGFRFVEPPDRPPERERVPELGADTDTVLEECGFSVEDVADLRAGGVV